MSDRAGAAAAHPATRVILWIDLVLLFLAGSQLNIHPDRTGEFFAWLIPVTLTAAFLGVGYWTALPSLVMAVRTRSWADVRLVLYMGLTLVTTELVVTVQDFEPFLLTDAPALAMIAAWIWVIGYFVLPPVNATAIALNRRTPIARTGATVALRPWALGVLGVYGVVLSVLGLGMLFFSGTLDGIWPWPVTKLTAGAISGWLLALAVGCWVGLRDGTWPTLRIVTPFYVLWFLAQLVTALRFDGDLLGSRGTVYLVALGVSAALFAAIGLAHERAGRTAGSHPAPAPS